MLRILGGSFMIAPLGDQNANTRVFSSFFLREVSSASDASRAAVNKKSSAGVRSCVATRSDHEESVPIRSIRVPAFLPSLQQSFISRNYKFSRELSKGYRRERVAVPDVAFYNSIA